MALLNVNFFSDVLGMWMQMDVILPQQSNILEDSETISTEKKVPVLYLLHGMSDDHSIWLRNTSIERYVEELGIAVIMPSVHLGWYTNMAHGNKYWTFISDELPKICHTFFNQLSTKREDHFVAGISMGGYGALKMGLAASDAFSAVASLSGALDVASICLFNQETEEKDFWFNIFGEAQQVKDSENDLLALATRLKQSGKVLPKIYMWCGTEDFLYGQSLTMKSHLESLDYEFTYEESPGDHQWKYWDTQIQSVLNWLPIQR
jgi:putative tributyrin esterase